MILHWTAKPARRLSASRNTPMLQGRKAVSIRSFYRCQSGRFIFVPIWHNESKSPERAGFSLHRAGGRLRGIFSFHGKRISPFDPQEKGIRIASEQLEEVRRLPIALPARGVAALDVAIRFAAASIIRCRSADLVGVQPNFRLPPVSTMRRAPAMPHSVSSLPPFYRHSRLTIVRRG